MKKVKVKIPAKINLTLDVLGEKNGYHEISSLVASLDIYDEITVMPLKEDIISLKFYGSPVYCETKKSNAYFAAEAFRKEFSSGGVDIRIKRNIPVAAGLGGSSADIAGVLSGMKKLYGVKKDLGFIAERLGSDVNYMMQSGYAVISNRGEQVRTVNADAKIYVVVLLGTKGVSAGESYRVFDELKNTYAKSTDNAVKFLEREDMENLFGVIKNDLQDASEKILPEISYSLSILQGFGKALMTGSGSAVYAVFSEKGKRNAAYKKLKKVFGERVIKAETVKIDIN